MYETIDFTIKGVAPLLMHSGRLANPLDPATKALKEVTSKRSKTDKDHEEIARLEFLGGLYVNDKGHPVIPGENIEAMLVNAGKKMKLGTQFKAGMFCDSTWPLEYSGPKTPATLWDDKRFVDIRGAKLNGKTTIQRCRPIFREWQLAFTIHYLPDMLNKSQVADSMRTGGRIIGLCDYKPRYGRFEVLA